MRAALALVLVACGAPRSAHVPREVLPYDAEFVMSSQRLRATLARDGILLDTTPVISTCDEPSVDLECTRCNVATVLDAIDPELVDRMAIAFARYPTSIRKAARLEHVAFCNTITYEGKDHGPAGLASPSDHRVFIGVEYFRTASRFGIEAAVHHEVFHLLDFETLGARVLADKEWHDLNPAGFAYQASTSTTRPHGFVNAYATTNEVEDRASTFELLMDRPEELCEIAAKDPIVARKVRLLWQRVSRLEGAKLLGVTAPCATKAIKPAKPPKRSKKPRKLKLTIE